MLRRHRPFLTLPVTLLVVSGLACNFAASPSVLTATQSSTALPAVTGTIPVGAASPPVADTATPAPPPSDTPIPPTATVVHVAIPLSPGVTNSFMTDRSSASLATQRRSIGDNLGSNLIERPFTANVMDYQGHLDLTRGELSLVFPWVYVTLFLEEAPPAGSAADYGVEVDADVDGRGEWLIVGAAPSSADWTTVGVRAFHDSDGDVGGLLPMKAEPSLAGNGFDDPIFDQGQGTDSDAAWIRLDPSDPARVQIAFKYALIGSPDKFIWGIWADEGVRRPDAFDYNDSFSPSEAGNPTGGSSDYPVKALASVDNACRWAFGFDPNGTEPGICPVPATPTPEPNASISGVAFRDTNGNGTKDGGESGGSGWTMSLGSGACTSSGLDTTTTASSGAYSFSGLAPGTYCVRVFLPPMLSYTLPSNGRTTVVLGAGEHRTGVNFGARPTEPF